MTRNGVFFVFAISETDDIDIDDADIQFHICCVYTFPKLDKRTFFDSSKHSVFLQVQKFRHFVVTDFLIDTERAINCIAM